MEIIPFIYEMNTPLEWLHVVGTFFVVEIVMFRKKRSSFCKQQKMCMYFLFFFRTTHTPKENGNETEP